MYYSEIVDLDTTNCIGIGVSIFVSGCTHHCEGCFNKETWNFKNGTEFTNETLQHLKELVSREYISCFSVLGGEPFEKQNKDTVLEIIKGVKEVKDLKVFIWSGYTYEVLVEDKVSKEILDLCDYLIDGEFELDKRDLNLLLRGSSNQRIIDLKATDKGSIVLDMV